jgi:predicted nucleic acid-binding protein
LISIIDSGFIYALLDQTDEHHASVVSAMQSYRGRILLPIPAITEVTFLLGRNFGVDATAFFLESLGDNVYDIEVPEIVDYVRSAEILRQYEDNNIDFVDACIVAIAERLKITKILTVDRRHFSVFRPEHCQVFELLP